jgi:DNA-binding transcriptional regulator YiaG
MKMTSHKLPKELPIVLRNLRKAGIRFEQIAYDLDVAWGTVKAWEVGRRKPKRATVQQIEHLYGVKIL